MPAILAAAEQNRNVFPQLYITMHNSALFPPISFCQIYSQLLGKCTAVSPPMKKKISGYHGERDGVRSTGRNQLPRNVFWETAGAVGGMQEKSLLSAEKYQSHHSSSAYPLSQEISSNSPYKKWESVSRVTDGESLPWSPDSPRAASIDLDASLSRSKTTPGSSWAHHPAGE